MLAALAAGDRTPAEVVARVYAAVDPALHPAAELSVRAHLTKLVREGRVRHRRRRAVRTWPVPARAEPARPPGPR